MDPGPTLLLAQKCDSGAGNIIPQAPSSNLLSCLITGFSTKRRRINALIQLRYLDPPGPEKTEQPGGAFSSLQRVQSSHNLSHRLPSSRVPSSFSFVEGFFFPFPFPLLDWCLPPPFSLSASRDLFSGPGLIPSQPPLTDQSKGGRAPRGMCRGLRQPHAPSPIPGGQEEGVSPIERA